MHAPFDWHSVINVSIVQSHLFILLHIQCQSGIQMRWSWILIIWLIRCTNVSSISVTHWLTLISFLSQSSTWHAVYEGHLGLSYRAGPIIFNRLFLTDTNTNVQYIKPIPIKIMVKISICLYALEWDSTGQDKSCQLRIHDMAGKVIFKLIHTSHEKSWQDRTMYKNNGQMMGNEKHVCLEHDKSYINPFFAKNLIRLSFMDHMFFFRI